MAWPELLQSADGPAPPSGKHVRFAADHFHDALSTRNCQLHPAGCCGQGRVSIHTVRSWALGRRFPDATTRRKLAAETGFLLTSLQQPSAVLWRRCRSSNRLGLQETAHPASQPSFGHPCPRCRFGLAGPSRPRLAQPASHRRTHCRLETGDGIDEETSCRRSQPCHPGNLRSILVGRYRAGAQPESDADRMCRGYVPRRWRELLPGLLAKQCAGRVYVLQWADVSGRADQRRPHLPILMKHSAAITDG